MKKRAMQERQGNSPVVAEGTRGRAETGGCVLVVESAGGAFESTPQKP
jgi:hypothetical protein